MTNRFLFGLILFALSFSWLIMPREYLISQEKIASTLSSMSLSIYYNNSRGNLLELLRNINYLLRSFFYLFDCSYCLQKKRKNRNFVKRFEEHSWQISLFFKRDKWTYFEMEILLKWNQKKFHIETGTFSFVYLFDCSYCLQKKGKINQNFVKMLEGLRW